MASVNKVHLIGRLTRDVEVRSFNGGGKVAKWGFAVTGERKKDQATGKWEDQPCFLDCEVFNRGEHGKHADNAEKYLSKGKQVYIEGHLKQENWTAQDGAKRSKLVVVVDSFQFLEAKPKDGGWPQMPRDQPDVAPTYAPDNSPGLGGDDLPF